MIKALPTATQKVAKKPNEISESSKRKFDFKLAGRREDNITWGYARKHAEK